MLPVGLRSPPHALPRIARYDASLKEKPAMPSRRKLLSHSATVAALLDGSYPYFKPLYMVIGAQAGAETKRFAAYLQSAVGRAILRAHGHAPL